jgi:hypothetical protein
VVLKELPHSQDNTPQSRGEVPVVDNNRLPGIGPPWACLRADWFCNALVSVHTQQIGVTLQYEGTAFLHEVFARASGR